MASKCPDLELVALRSWAGERSQGTLPSRAKLKSMCSRCWLRLFLSPSLPSRGSHPLMAYVDPALSWLNALIRKEPGQLQSSHSLTLLMVRPRRSYTVQLATGSSVSGPRAVWSFLLTRLLLPTPLPRMSTGGGWAEDWPPGRWLQPLSLHFHPHPRNAPVCSPPHAAGAGSCRCRARGSPVCPGKGGSVSWAWR